MRISSIGRLAALAAAALTIGNGPARADDKSEIKALYKKLERAMKAKDVKAILATGTADFTHKGAGMPTMDAKATAQMMEQQFKLMKSLDKVVMSPDKIMIHGGSATVLSSFQMKGTMTMPDGKVHSMTDSGTSKETLVKTKKGWLFKVVEMGTSKPMMDGKPMQMGAPPAKK
jgi:ketosteroid isomerase-like protein